MKLSNNYKGEEMSDIDQMAEKVAALVLQKMGHRFNNEPERKMFTAQETADYLCVSLSTVYKYSHGRVIPFYKPNGRDIFFMRSDLDAYLAAQRFASRDELDAKAADYLVESG